MDSHLLFNANKIAYQEFCYTEMKLNRRFIDGLKFNSSIMQMRLSFGCAEAKALELWINKSSQWTFYYVKFMVFGGKKLWSPKVFGLSYSGKNMFLLLTTLYQSLVSKAEKAIKNRHWIDVSFLFNCVCEKLTFLFRQILAIGIGFSIFLALKTTRYQRNQ